MKLDRRLQTKIDVLARLGDYLLSGDTGLQQVKEEAYRRNSWFIPSFTDAALENIARAYLDRDKLEAWLGRYPGQKNAPPKRVGVVMAGNIPAVGFHDLLCVFLSGHIAAVKLSSKDETLIRHLVTKLVSWDPEIAPTIEFCDMLKGCDAYIATGSNNTARYFHHYFGKYPNIIRKNRTSIAVLDGNETRDELEKLGDDVFLYFGLGCRNITKVWVPEGYDFAPLLEAFKPYTFLKDNHHYSNNFDYNLSLVLLNRIPYLTNGMILLTEQASPFSPISVLHYEQYRGNPPAGLAQDENIQGVTGRRFLPFGTAQQPALGDYADGIDTMRFLTAL